MFFFGRSRASSSTVKVKQEPVPSDDRIAVRVAEAGARSHMQLLQQQQHASSSSSVPRVEAEAESEASEDERARKQRKRRADCVKPARAPADMFSAKHEAKRTKPGAMLVQTRLDGSPVDADAEAVPMVRSFSDFHKKFPSVRDPSNNGPITLERSKAVLEESVRAVACDERIREVEYVRAEIRKLIDKMPRPSFKGVGAMGLTSPVSLDVTKLAETMTDALRASYYVLPLLTTDIASELLAQSGAWPRRLSDGTQRTIQYPPCMHDKECTGMLGEIPGLSEPCVLTAFMTRGEYNHLLKGGLAPTEPRPCILCHRRYAHHMILKLRPGFKIVGAPGTSFCFQMYRVLVGQPGGYFREYCITPERRYEGFFDAFPVYRRSLLAARRDVQGQGGRWIVSQDPMVFKRPVLRQPVPGQSLREFRAVNEQGKVRVPHFRVARVCLPTHFVVCVHLAERLDPARRERRGLEEAMKVHRRKAGHADRPLYPEIHSRVLACSYWYSERKSSNEIVTILSKFIPQPCSTRLYPRIIKQIFHPEVQPADPERERKLTDAKYHAQIVSRIVCCLFCADVPVLEKRDSRQPPLDLPSANFDAARIVETCPEIIAIAVRLYLAHSYDDDPVFAHHLGAMFPVAKFVELCADAANAVRKLARAQGTTEGPAFHAAVKKVHQVVHKKLRAVSQKRQRESMLHELASTYCIPGQTVPIDPTLDEPLRALLREWVHRLNPAEWDIVLHTAVEQGLPALFVECGPPCDEVFRFPDPVTGDASDAGNPSRWLADLAVRYNFMRLGRTVFKAEIQRFREVYPVTHTFFRTLAVEWRRHMQRRVYTLPAHYAANQMRACRERVGIPENAGVYAECFRMVFCEACDKVLNVVCKKARKDASKTNVQFWGVERAATDPFTMELQCWTCSRPGTLREISLLGQTVVIGRKFYFICPQKGCGTPAVYNPEQCTWTRRGLACAECSAYEREKHSDYVVHPICKTDPKRVFCDICSTFRPRRATHSFYGGLFVCRVHRTPALDRFVAKGPLDTESPDNPYPLAATPAQLADRDFVMGRCVQFRADRKAAAFDKNAARHKRELQRSRRRTRSRKRKR